MIKLPRQNMVRLDFGENSCGKTPTQIYDLTAYQKIYPNKNYIVFEGQDKFRDAHDRGQLRVDFFIKKGNKGWAGTGKNGLQEFREPTPGNKIYRFAHSVLVVDDFKLLLSGHDTPADFLGLFALRPSPKFNMEMWFSCHEPRNILEGIAGYPTHYHVYRNNASRSQFEDKILGCYRECVQASFVVNEYSRLYPGHYDVQTHTPYFPHIVVEKDNPLPLRYVNMDTIKLKPILDEFTNSVMAKQD